MTLAFKRIFNSTLENGSSDGRRASVLDSTTNLQSNAQREKEAQATVNKRSSLMKRLRIFCRKRSCLHCDCEASLCLLIHTTGQRIKRCCTLTPLQKVSTKQRSLWLTSKRSSGTVAVCAVEWSLCCRRGVEVANAVQTNVHTCRRLSAAQVLLARARFSTRGRPVANEVGA